MQFHTAIQSFYFTDQSLLLHCGKNIFQQSESRHTYESILTHPCYLFVSLTSPTNEIHALILTNPCNNFKQIQQFEQYLKRGLLTE